MASASIMLSLVQLIVTDDMRGRAMSVYNLAFRGGMPMGSRFWPPDAGLRRLGDHDCRRFAAGGDGPVLPAGRKTHFGAVAAARPQLRRSYDGNQAFHYLVELRPGDVTGAVRDNARVGIK